MLMKLFIVLLLSVIGSASYCQSNIDQIKNYFISNSIRLPADKVFLHLDRNLYQPGDTIRFQAYIKDRQTGIFETKSPSLHCMLVNSFSTTIDSSRFRIINSSASGWLKIPEDQQFGDYSVIAFTGKMMNYNPAFVFSAPVRIDRLRPVNNPSLSKSDSAGYQSDNILFPQTTVDLRFLPEGGTLIYGIKQKLAFNAVTSTGKTLKIAGFIKNQKGEIISSFKSGNYGPGSVEFTPNERDTLTAVLDGDEFSGMTWQLPVPSVSGVALKVKNNEDGILDITIDPRNVTSQKFILAMSMNEVLVLSGEVKADSTRNFRINTDELPIGTACLTLFDDKLNPVAERLVFINSWRKLNFEISTLKAQFSRGEETELTISSKDIDGEYCGAIVSVSIIDSMSGYYNQMPVREIEGYMLFDDEFYNNLPLKIRMEGLSNIDDENIDLLLLTYGWRRFNLKESSGSEYANKIMEYDFLTIKSATQGKKVRDEIKVMSIEGSEMIILKPGTNNEFILRFDTLSPEVRQIIIMPDDSKSKNSLPVTVEFQGNKNFTDRAKSLQTTIRGFVLDIPLSKKTETDFGLDSAIMIEPVTIKGYKEKKQPSLNKYQLQYQFANTTTVTKQEMTNCFTLEDILVRLQPYILDTRKKLIYFRPTRAVRGLPSPALFVIDDVPLFDGTGNSYSLISELPASQIESVTALKNNRGYTFYGSEANGGVVFVTTKGKAMMDGSYKEEAAKGPPVKNDLIRPVRIYRSEIEYYIPKREEVLTNPEYQYRPTILWQNEIILDGKGVAKIRFPNNMVKGTVMVIVNGVSVDNIPGCGFYRYSIK
jgi:hypothetical protein